MAGVGGGGLDVDDLLQELGLRGGVGGVEEAEAEAGVELDGPAGAAVGDQREVGALRVLLGGDEGLLGQGQADALALVLAVDRDLLEVEERAARVVAGVADRVVVETRDQHRRVLEQLAHLGLAARADVARREAGLVVDLGGRALDGVERAARREARRRVVAIYGRRNLLQAQLGLWTNAFNANPPDLEAGRYQTHRINDWFIVPQPDGYGDVAKGFQLVGLNPSVVGDRLRFEQSSRGNATLRLIDGSFRLDTPPDDIAPTDQIGWQKRVTTGGELRSIVAAQLLAGVATF